MVDPELTDWLLEKIKDAGELYVLHEQRPHDESVDQAHAVGLATGVNRGAVEAYCEVGRRLGLDPALLSTVEARALGLDEPQSNDPQLNG